MKQLTNAKEQNNPSKRKRNVTNILKGLKTNHNMYSEYPVRHERLFSTNTGKTTSMNFKSLRSRLDTAMFLARQKDMTNSVIGYQTNAKNLEEES
eukprot:CAMPEP_0168578858 /NCGR_PEP_ID=MMETSP0413-20121227/21556_1 /TAXON_ID=136452 /ORGANISM="Filamoeba nolandi, Strain NC-AS-23-1" /LENGTH=94 /DNA_ID=CAMNT_0008612731 /DNA_START=260 /DNA_END=544 /DNA_ORIENTATION=+